MACNPFQHKVSYIWEKQPGILSFLLFMLTWYSAPFDSLSPSSAAACFSEMESPAFLKYKIQHNSSFPPRHFLGMGYYLQKAKECLISLILASLQRKESTKSPGVVEEEEKKKEGVFFF